jgi:hypothetical protein
MILICGAGAEEPGFGNPEKRVAGLDEFIGIRKHRSRKPLGRFLKSHGGCGEVLLAGAR